jgi:transcriptional regulator with PAS, ATPase and Fis domain
MVVDTAAVCTPAATWNESVAPLDDNALIFGKKMQELLANIDRIAKSDFSVLLHGETGTGKEVIAAQIHERGPRRKNVFKAVNCGAIHENLIESELFGHEKNSFTGAAGRKEGFFEVTDGGTLFLDEIGDLPAAAQAKLLRVLDSGRFYRLGSTEEVEVDVRIIAATHHNLKDMVEEGRFRKDLYFRLNALVVQIPPLRERKDEIEPLCRLFLRDNKTVSQGVRGISEEAMRLLRAYPWPGNIRELKNAIERAAALADGDVIQRGDLPPEVRAVEPAPEDAPSDALSTVADLAEKQMLEEVLKETGGSKRAAAQRLGKSLSTVQRKIKKHGIDPRRK